MQNHLLHINAVHCTYVGCDNNGVSISIPGPVIPVGDFVRYYGVADVPPETMMEEDLFVDHTVNELTAEVKPAEVKPAEVKPAEVKPAEVKPAEVKPAKIAPEPIAPTVSSVVVVDDVAEADPREKLSGSNWADIAEIDNHDPTKTDTDAVIETVTEIPAKAVATPVESGRGGFNRRGKGPRNIKPSRLTKVTDDGWNVVPTGADRANARRNTPNACPNGFGCKGESSEIINRLGLGDDYPACEHIHPAAGGVNHIPRTPQICTFGTRDGAHGTKCSKRYCTHTHLLARNWLHYRANVPDWLNDDGNRTLLRSAGLEYLIPLEDCESGGSSPADAGSVENTTSPWLTAVMSTPAEEAADTPAEAAAVDTTETENTPVEPNNEPTSAADVYEGESVVDEIAAASV